MRSLFLGQLYTAAFNIRVQRTVGGVGALHTVTIPAGYYWWSGTGGAEDLARTVQTLIIAAHADFAAFSILRGDDGRVSMRAGAGTVRVTWHSTGGERLRDWMRYTGATLDVTSAARVYGAYQAHGCWLCAYGLQLDEEAEDAVGSLARSDDGTVECHTYGESTRRTLGVQWWGLPEDGAANEYDVVRAFWHDFLRTGQPIRWYRDATVTTAWARWTNPNGYRAFQALGPRGWAPTRVFDHQAGLWRMELALQEA